jgi:hypothetical protein
MSTADRRTATQASQATPESEPPVSTGFHVHPAELTASGEAAHRTAEGLRTDLGALPGPSDAAVAALPGWRTAAALHECTEAWLRLLTGLAEDMDTTGADLRRTADHYTGTEQDVQGLLKAVV